MTRGHGDVHPHTKNLGVAGKKQDNKEVKDELALRIWRAGLPVKNQRLNEVKLNAQLLVQRRPLALIK